MYCIHSSSVAVGAGGYILIIWNSVLSILKMQWSAWKSFIDKFGFLYIYFAYFEHKHTVTTVSLGGFANFGHFVMVLRADHIVWVFVRGPVLLYASNVDILLIENCSKFLFCILGWHYIAIQNFVCFWRVFLCLFTFRRNHCSLACAHL